jgi:uncharacterized protein YjbI with pentapeptide repeats
LNGANFLAANLFGVDFYTVLDLERADLTGARLRGQNLDDLKSRGAIINYTEENPKFTAEDVRHLLD